MESLKNKRLIDWDGRDFAENIRQILEPYIDKIVNLESKINTLLIKSEQPVNQKSAMRFVGLGATQFIEYEKAGAIHRINDTGHPVYYKSQLEGAKERYKAILKAKRTGIKPQVS